MKKNLTRPLLALTIVGSLLPIAAQAQLVISEVNPTAAVPAMEPIGLS
ncbi:MAG: hypothetical protein WDN00_14175 [Limisphaerales bacterium]